MHSKSFIRIGVRGSSEGAFDGAAISAHSQVATFDPLTPQSLICKRGDNNLRGMIHSNLTHMVAVLLSVCKVMARRTTRRGIRK
jgi:hypothetical protein